MGKDFIDHPGLQNEIHYYMVFKEACGEEFCRTDYDRNIF
jgi:hypothetical protein